RASQHAHHDVWRGAEETEEWRGSEPGAERVAGEARACRQRREVGAEMTLRIRPKREIASLRQTQHRPGAYRETHGRREGKDRLPSEQGVEDTSDEWGDHRHEHHDRGDQPDHGCWGWGVVEIADDRAADGLSGRGAERLRDARDDESCDARRED